MPVSFKISDVSSGDDALTIEGFPQSSSINISHLIENLKYDREIAGYILVSSREAIYIDASKYRVIPIQR